MPTQERGTNQRDGWADEQGRGKTNDPDMI